jgi:UDPglucose 6-dehydrogenase
MNITVTGMGYVGLITAASLAEIGHNVICLDIEENKIASMVSGKLNIFEPGLKELIDKNINKNRLAFTYDPKVAYQNPECVFITVGTPGDNKGSVDLAYVFNSIRSLVDNLQNDTIVAIKSTVPVGTCEKIQKMIDSNIQNKLTVKVISNPEFLREGSGIHDSFHADRIIVGTEDDFIKEFLNQLYLPFQIPIVYTEVKSAEMIKYAANAFLATKISFINEIAQICEITDADIEEVAYGIGLDKRIGSSFLQAGIGYGGSCFPKDTIAFAQFSEENNYQFEILTATINVNQSQKHWPISKLNYVFNTLEGLDIAILGLTFKPLTDDLRSSPSIDITKRLLEEGVKITVFDPAASRNFKKIVPNIKIAATIEEAIMEKQAVLILTEWPEIQQFDLHKYKAIMNTPIVIDGRNCYLLKEAEKALISYYSVGRRPINPKKVR